MITQILTQCNKNFKNILTQIILCAILLLQKVIKSIRRITSEVNFEPMSEKEKKAADELLKNVNAIPKDAEDFVRGYLQGRIDGLKSTDAETTPA